jgi:hypothetical protein
MSAAGAGQALLASNQAAPPNAADAALRRYLYWVLVLTARSYAIA